MFTLAFVFYLICVFLSLKANFSGPISDGVFWCSRQKAVRRSHSGGNINLISSSSRRHLVASKRGPPFSLR